MSWDTPCIRPSHILEEGCRFEDGGCEVARRTKKQSGQRAGAGPCRNPAIQVSGAADGAPTTDDLDLDIDVQAIYDEGIPEEEPFGIFKGAGRSATKEENGGDIDPPPIQNQNSKLDVVDLEAEETKGGYEDRLSPIDVREQRVDRARRVLGFQSQRGPGDKTDQAAAEDNRTTDVAKVSKYCIVQMKQQFKKHCNGYASSGIIARQQGFNRYSEPRAHQPAYAI